jgi:hypothetical protein
MENKWKLVIVAFLVLALLLIAGVAIVNKPSSATPSQKAILAPSDMPEQGWRQVDVIDQPLEDPSTEDCWESTLVRYGSNGIGQAVIIIDLYHLNSSETAFSRYDSLLYEYSRTNGTAVEQVPVGDAGFTAREPITNPDLGRTSQVYFVKGSYVTFIRINWSDLYDGSYKDAVQIAKIQAEKLP